MADFWSGLIEHSTLRSIAAAPPPASKVVGGNFALPNEFPYQLQLKNKKGAHICGATLISTLLAITAAHCVDEIVTPEDLQVLSGQHKTNQIEGTEQSRVARKIIMHKHYDPDSISNDIALIVLADDFVLNAQTNIALIPNGTTKFRATAYTTGWGDILEGSRTVASALKKAPVPLISLEDCRKMYNDTGMIVADKTICAGTKGRSSCHGDSGGPLTCFGENGLKYFCGIVSWAYGCALERYPVVYADVSKYTGWIQTQIDRLRALGHCPRDSHFRRCSLNFETVTLEKATLLVNPCAMDQFHCRISHKCIPLAFRCDEEYDCGTSDHSDESGCPSISLTTPTPCDPSRFQCKVTGKCLPRHYVCDGDKDCGEADISDEIDCNLKCSYSEFPCRTEHHIITKCIPGDNRCNGVDDCGDNSDEANCNPVTTQTGTPPPCINSPYYFECRISKRCISSNSICNDEASCGEGDSSDEDNCDFEKGCHRTQFACSNGNSTEHCIPNRFLCDGEDDCGDNSDEVFCIAPEGFQCNSGQFTCLSEPHGLGSRCIPASYRCDGNDDCGDNSDETNCSIETPGSPTVK